MSVKKAVPSVPTRRTHRPEEWPGVFVVNASHFHPFPQAFDSFQMRRHNPLLATLAKEFEDLMLCLTPMIANLEPDQFTDPTC